MGAASPSCCCQVGQGGVQVSPKFQFPRDFQRQPLPSLARALLSTAGGFSGQERQSIWPHLRRGCFAGGGPGCDHPDGGLDGPIPGGIAWDGSKLQFNAHPLCMVIGMVFLQGDALLVYRVFRHESKRSTKILHGLLHALALVIALVGLIAVFQFHKKQSIPDMYSLHSWCGILAFGFYFVQWLLGWSFFLFPGASFSLRSRYKPQHVFFGAALLILSVATALLGSWRCCSSTSRRLTAPLPQRESLPTLWASCWWLLGPLWATF
ncbi:Cytochrome b-561 [Podarcis lilfordi]|uniref:Transmembrane ascorbate-dependent reductase CYB561 n=1 Tax=Podarcis lilfordi TaxID=74358 RepID=A0AA35JTR9_9SAUR|nr:Cytochrome b-561 [Podarcis lilfordi]